MVIVKDVLSLLKHYNVRFVLIGGQAAVIQGSAYLTADIDICYARDKENIGNLVKAISPFHPYLRGAPKDLPFIFDMETLINGLNFTLSTDRGDIDLLGEVTGIGSYGEVVKFSETLEIYGMPCQVLTIEGLIKSKKAVSRPKDIAVIKELQALMEIREQKEDKKNENKK